MPNKPEIALEALFIIVDFDRGNVLTDLFKKNNMPVFLLTRGYGSAKSTIYDILGYGGPKKKVSISIQTKGVSGLIMSQLRNKIDFKKPGTGIAFTINLSSVSNALLTVCRKVNDNLKTKDGGEAMATKSAYHLIITIVNTGYFEQVMNIAKTAGATGGTLIHARGLGSEEAMKYLGITIQPEKDLVLILTPKEEKLAIMESITNEVGLNTAGKGICFSLPVDGVMGFGTGVCDADKC
ncbi:MAG: P-II family nitrogen regulator [Clostridium sp.]|nr:P-II family nitrogen regulator [Clostridium sp.]